MKKYIEAYKKIFSVHKNLHHTKIHENLPQNRSIQEDNE